jgi:hypothetical protein
MDLADLDCHVGHRPGLVVNGKVGLLNPSMRDMAPTRGPCALLRRHAFNLMERAIEEKIMEIVHWIYEYLKGSPVIGRPIANPVSSCSDQIHRRTLFLSP